MLVLAERAPGLAVTAPRAVGRRAAYPAVPESVRSWVDHTLGSPVVAVSEQVGGMSPGCASRVACADGTRAFVKAVGPELNPLTPNLFRREIAVLQLLGSHPLWAELLASYDVGPDGWVALLLEDVDGAHPDLTDDAVMAVLLESTDELGRVLHRRVPRVPQPDPENGGLNDLGLGFAAWAESLDHVWDLPPALLPDWVRERAPQLQEGVRALAEHPRDRLVHFDIRDDNLVERPDGALVFVDWGATSLGPAWMDPLLARLERVQLPWFDAETASCAALADVGEGTVTSVLVGLGTFLAWRAHTAVDVNLPTLGAFRRAESERFLSAAARRLRLVGDLGGQARPC